MLQRAIPGAPDRDAIGCYPLFTCEDWTALAPDVDGLRQDLVCLSLVTDPLGGFDPGALQRVFPDVCVPFKEHFVVDLRRPLTSFISAHHRRNVARAAHAVEVELCPHPARHAAEWTALYANLIARHGITGIPAFSAAALTEQLAVPGLAMFRAVHRSETVGMILWYEHGEAATYHLGAYSDAGYALRASFALFACAIEHFAHRLAWLNLGGAAGVRRKAADGLSRFKQGWATGTRPAYFCGRVFDRGRYAELTRRNGDAAPAYFPAYRSGEFA